MTSNNQGLFRQRLIAEEKSAELARKHPLARQRIRAKRLSRRRTVAVDLLPGMAGLAGVGALGGALGGLLLDHTVRSSAPFAVAFQVGIGSVMVAGIIFAVLGALGHVVFGDVVGDFRAESGPASPLPGDRFAAVAVEFVGGASWGVVCGILLGVVAAAVGVLLGVAGPILAGTVSGVLLGLVLAMLACVFRSIRGKEEAAKASVAAVPYAAYFRPTEAVGGELDVEEAVRPFTPPPAASL